MKLQHIIFFSFFFVFALTANAQDGISIKDASKKLQKKFKKLNEHSQKGELDKVIKKCDDILKANPNIMEVQLRKASTLYNQRNYIPAEEVFKKAVQLDPDFDYRMYYSLGTVQHKLKKFEAAASSLREFVKRSEGKKKVADHILRLMANCEFAANAVKNPVAFKPQKLSPKVNTESNEYLPVLPLDGSQMIFTVRSGGQEDFFVSDVQADGTMGESRPLSGLNTPYNEGACTISADGKIVIFASDDRVKSRGSFDLFYSFMKNGEWGIIHTLGKTVNSPTWDSQPSLSADGNELYFSSRRKDGIGGSDLYVSRRNMKGGWNIPENLGAQINTKYDDESPFIHPDGRTLYFRSNGRPGMGDFDIYISRLDSKTSEWSDPINIGYPINTEGSEGALTVSPDGVTAYFSSDQHYKNLNQEPNLDIFKFELPEEARPTPVTYVKGNFVDDQTNKPIRASFKIIDNESQEVLHDITQNEVKSFFLSLPVGSGYSLNIEKDGYNFYSENFALDSIRTIVKPYIKEFRLSPLPKIEEKKSDDIVFNQVVTLKNIFFETGSAVLDKRSEPEINALHSFLKDKSIKIKIIGHTDNVGQETDNQLLSKNRAKAVYDSLIEKGISSQRLQYEGKGESEAIADNDTPEGRKLNRRTEFIILQ